MDITIRVAIIDDHPVVIEGVASWLTGDSRIEVVHTGDDVDELAADNRLKPDVVLLDLSLHGRMDLDNVAKLADTGQRVVVYSQFTAHGLILRTLESGAKEFVAKHEGREHLVKAVVAVAADQPYVGPVMAGALISDGDADRPRLSDQERTALLLWFQSSSKASVARKMQVSPHTVDMYIRRARQKYEKAGRSAYSKSELLARALEDNLVAPEELNGDAP